MNTYTPSPTERIVLLSEIVAEKLDAATELDDAAESGELTQAIELNRMIVELANKQFLEEQKKS